ncbi:hypothetical protein [Kamptonema sp. UHCC 0994]|uniref:hypothetical protein n=1 Tax=Kamptonema sp. UHCC 0994 TaxID=3031329 RepID=UPI0023B8EE74|nr:hypothetical protein [Kamptonema sp. UHCC 0994]MDF0552546.1 hypothetical protein [Kamptonema sp. UHCC 0994]
MPYQIAFEYHKVAPKLRQLKQDNPEIAQQIYDELDRLAVERENFITGAPERPESFLVGNIRILYLVYHTMQLINVFSIIELP